MEKKCIITTIDDFNPHVNSSVIFFISSAIYPNCYSDFSPKERLEQTVYTLQSVRKHFPNSTIILSEASCLTDSDIIDLLPYLDYMVLFGYKSCMGILGKNSGEKYMSIEIVQHLKNCTFDIMYKLSGRYYLTDNFNTKDFSKTKITLRRSTWRPERLCMVTVLYSVPKCQYANYKNALEKSLLSSDDIEHSLFQNLESDSYIEIPKVNVNGTLPDKSPFYC